MSPAADYESQAEPGNALPYDGSTLDITTVTATDASDNAATQVITVSIQDVGGIDDNPNTGTGTSTSTATGTGAATATVETGTDTGTEQELAQELTQELAQELTQEQEQELELN